MGRKPTKWELRELKQKAGLPEERIKLDIKWTKKPQGGKDGSKKDTNS